MAKGHPLDSAGRVLPHAWWPADRQAPGELEFVRRFCNSVNRENGAERFASAGELDSWLIGEGASPIAAGSRQLGRVLAVRDLVRALVVANTGHVPAEPSWRQLAEQGVTFRAVHEGDALLLAPAGDECERLIGRIVQAVIVACADGTWPRLKACQHCQWVVFDPSKNRSSRWCSMQACGGRHNAREYRRRNRSTV
jgi:predicted RNA-binding Zn ribbon-like protein